MPPTFPRPRAGHLTIYLGGSAGGFGESIVLHMPDGRWIVVDVCCCQDNLRSRQSWNFPLTLLRQLGAPQIDLLALTHPDDDHFRGLQELVEGYSGRVEEMWTFPRHNLREMAYSASRTIRNATTGRRYQLFRFLDYIIHDEHNIAPIEPRFPTGRYSQAAYDIRAVLPTRQDHLRWQHEAELHAEDLAALGTDPDTQLKSDITRKLKDGEVSELEANMLSLGLVIQWGDIKVFLPGDMEVEPNHPGNWAGMLEELDRRSATRGLLDGVDVVKAPHHGSRSGGGTALHEPTWERLRGGRSRVPYVLLTPKNGGTNPPPQRDGLAWMAARSHVMGMTAAPRPSSLGGGWGYAADAASGWRAMGGAGEDGMGSWVMLDVSPHGYITRRAGDQARWFVRRV